MNNQLTSKLRFNFGFLLEADLGTFRTVELNYPTILISERMTLSPLKGNFWATRISEGIYLSGKLHSKMAQPCVRCLENADVPITIKIDELFYYPPPVQSEEEYLITDDGFANLAPLIHELTVLSMPIQPLCKVDCQGLCMVCGQNLNEGDCDCEEDNIDPRMAVLKSLLN